MAPLVRAAIVRGECGGGGGGGEEFCGVGESLIRVWEGLCGFGEGLSGVREGLC